MKLIKINGIDVSNAISFAYDGCHKIYLCRSKKAETEHTEMGYEILPLNDLPKVYETSCCLRFINWDNLKNVIEQFENYVEFEFDNEEMIIVKFNKE